MSTVSFGTSLANRSYTWTEFKTFITPKGLAVQYDDDGIIYAIFGCDGPTILVCIIWKGTVPDGVIAGGYSQAQNDSDKSDFETNYKPSANGRLSTSSSISDGTNQAAVKAASTAAVAADPSLVVALSPNSPVPAGTNTIGAVKIVPASAAALANVTSSATSVTLIASNANRRMAMIFNDSTQKLYVKFGATASTSSFTVQIDAGGYYELPTPVYTGVVGGIWSSANGAARITELT